MKCQAGAGPGAGTAELAQILPELAAGAPAHSPVEPEVARFRLFDEVASLLRAGADRQPIVLVVDDLHAADASSLMLLRFLPSALADSHVLLVGAFRDVDPTLREPLSETLAELLREPAARYLPLTGLRPDEVAEYVQLTAGYEPPERVATAIHRETEGNPLFVGEIVRPRRRCDHRGRDPADPPCARIRALRCAREGRFR